MVEWTFLLFGTAAAVAVGVVVYRDARRIRLDRPRFWGGVVFSTTMLGVLVYTFFPGVPIPGLLVIYIAGPAIYLFERDDSMHEDTADPTMLPDQPREGEKTEPTDDDDRG